MICTVKGEKEAIDEILERLSMGSRWTDRVGYMTYGYGAS